MPRTIINHATLFREGQFIEDQTVCIDQGRISEWTESSDPQDQDLVIDLQGDYLIPGFIDLHIHGVQDYLIDNGKEDIEQVSRILPSYGTTGFLPTIIPHPPEIEDAYLQEASLSASTGASILGFFCEGPFLAKTGAILPQALADKSLDRLKRIQQLLTPHRVIFAVSPEIDGAVELITSMHPPVFITHTQASVDQTRAAIDAGARHATHFYDVFPIPDETDMGVRPCGAVEVLLADNRVSVDFILDGEHVDPQAVRLAQACKPLDQIALVTDSNIGAGFPPGTYQGFGEDEISFAYPGAPARGTEKSHAPGCLFGSGLTQIQAVKNVLAFGLGELEDAVMMASKAPAKVLGLDSHKGDTFPGFDADLVHLDKDLKIRRTWVSGNLVFDMTDKKRG